MNRRPTSTLLVLASLLVAARADAAWAPDGTALSTASGAQDLVQAVSDGAGGAVVTWEDERSGVFDIYAQRVDAFGSPQWTTGGVAICTATGSQTGPVIASDGAGGAIIAWQDGRVASSDIYAQHVDASGATQWTAGGTAICTASGIQALPAIDTDGAGGAVIAWHDQRSGNDDVYVQRIDLTGTAVWAANGVAACTNPTQQGDIRVVTDGSQGAILVWFDARNGSSYDLYAQAVNFFGSPAWTANGVPVCTAAGHQLYPEIVSDGAGGAIIAWEDQRAGNIDVYAQRLDYNGTPLWTTNGIAVSAPATGDQGQPQITADGTGGAIVAWYDTRSLSDTDIYAQHLDASGSPRWTQDGIPVCDQGSPQNQARVAADGEGGAVFLWIDQRNTPSTNVFAQRMDAAGTALWTQNGVALSTAPNGQVLPVVTVDAGGAIATWVDFRSSSGSDVYAQRVELTYGAWGHPEPVLTAAADVPGDQGGRVAVNWTASGRDRTAPRNIGSYSIWRAVDTAGSAPSVPSPALLAHALEAGDSGSTARASAGYYWELVGTQPAQGWSAYSFSAPTRSDSVSTDPGTEYFLVAAHDAQDDFVAYASDVLTGHSVDNLAPAAPLALSAQRVGNDVVLAWDRSEARDLRDYSVYRATSSGVTPMPANFLTASGDTSAIDAGAPSTALWYIVTATDVHENEGPPSNEASVAGATGVAGLPEIAGLSLLPNRPNPFRSGTELTVGLAEAGDVSVVVYDVSGRPVRRLEAPGQSAGWIRLPFDGRDGAGRPLPSGVYFYRVRAGGVSAAGDMVIAR